jgi:hypothetical protein
VTVPGVVLINRQSKVCVTTPGADSYITQGRVTADNTVTVTIYNGTGGAGSASLVLQVFVEEYVNVVPFA